MSDTSTSTSDTMNESKTLLVKKELHKMMMDNQMDCNGKEENVYDRLPDEHSDEQGRLLIWLQTIETSKYVRFCFQSTDITMYTSHT